MAPSREASLNWREPGVVRRARRADEERRRSLASRLLFIFLGIGYGLALWFAARAGRGDAAPGPKVFLYAALLFGLLFGLLLAYGLPELLSAGSSRVRLGRHSLALGKQAWPYRELARCRIEFHRLGGETVPFLVLTEKRGETALIGIDPAVSLARVERLLAEKGVTVERAPAPEKKSGPEAAREFAPVE